MSPNSCQVSVGRCGYAETIFTWTVPIIKQDYGITLFINVQPIFAFNWRLKRSHELILSWCCSRKSREDTRGNSKEKGVAT